MRMPWPILAALRRIGFGAAGSTYYQGSDGIEVEVAHPGIAGKLYTSTVDGIEWGAAGMPTGHYEPMIDNSDPADPSPIYLGDGDILMLWVED